MVFSPLPPTFSPGPVLSEQTRLQWWCRNVWNLSDLFPGNISPWHGQKSKNIFLHLATKLEPFLHSAPLCSGCASDPRTLMEHLWNIYRTFMEVEWGKEFWQMILLITAMPTEGEKANWCLNAHLHFSPKSNIWGTQTMENSSDIIRRISRTRP